MHTILILRHVRKCADACVRACTLKESNEKSKRHSREILFFVFLCTKNKEVVQHNDYMNIAPASK